MRGTRTDGEGEDVSADQLYQRVAEILEQARGQVARTVNTVMVHACWHIGREIVEVEQAGEQRAGYGEEVIGRLSARLKKVFGKGFSERNLLSMRQFYLAFPAGSALPEIRQAVPAKSVGTIPQALPAKSGGRAVRRALPGKAGKGPARRALPGTSGKVAVARSRTGTIRSAPPNELGDARFPPALGWTHYVILMRVANPTGVRSTRSKQPVSVGRRASSRDRSARCCSIASRSAATRRRCSRWHGRARR
jgi:hypothetical protein